MTEKQGGSDVRANETRRRSRSGDGEYLLTGHKWFCSAPMCDAFLVLAQAPGGLSCFLLPRVLPDGTRNGFRIQRLKDKLGNRSNASRRGRVRGRLARGWSARRAAASGRSSRWSTTRGSTACSARPALMRARGRRGDPPRRPPRGVRPAARRAAADAERARRPLRRVGGGDRDGACGWRAPSTSGDARRSAGSRRRSAKYWVCKRGAAARRRGARVPRRQRLRRGVRLPRLYRESPGQLDLGGLGQRQCARRAARARPRAGEPSRRSSPRSSSRAAPTRGSTTAIARLQEALADPEETRERARRLVERLALALQGSLLVRHAPRRGRGRVLRDAPRRRGRPRVRDAAAAASTLRRSSSATGPLASGSVPSVRVEIIYCPV